MKGPTAAPPRYRDRCDAGSVLAELVGPLVAHENCVVLALPRGGVPVAAPVAAALGAPLDVLLVRKLGVPDQPELAMGALAEVAGAVELIRNDRVLRRGAVDDETFAGVVRAETAVLAARRASYRAQPAPDVGARTVIVVDDGLATGSTMRAALAALRRRGPRRVVVAVPVGAPATCDEIAREVDTLVCPRRPIRFRAVGEAYDDFSPTTDDEVRTLLAR